MVKYAKAFAEFEKQAEESSKQSLAAFDEVHDLRKVTLGERHKLAREIQEIKTSQSEQFLKLDTKI